MLTRSQTHCSSSINRSGRRARNFTLMLVLVLSAILADAALLTKEDLTSDFDRLIENKLMQATAVGVIQPGGSIAAYAGSLNPHTADAPKESTLFEIGSISKVFTSVLLADAVVRGEVALDTPIARLLPSGIVMPDNAGDRITLRMLATHTSGLPLIPAEIRSDDYANPYGNYVEADLWTTLQRVKLDFPPGTKAGYSNLAVGLLGTSLARNVQMTYGQLLAERITEPLGMTDTVIEPGSALRARFAPPFTSAGKPWTHWDFKALAGAGGIRSTLPDLMRFVNAVLSPDDSPLGEGIELAWTRQELAESFSAGGQALGWMLAGDGQTRWHNGMTGGFHAAMFINRDQGVAVVLLSNRSTPVGTQIAEGIFRRAMGGKERVIPNRDRNEVELSAEQIDVCAGTFRLDERTTIVCERRNLALYVTLTGQPTDRLYAAAPDLFFSRRAPIEIQFLPPIGGNLASALVIRSGRRELHAKRE